MDSGGTAAPPSTNPITAGDRIGRFEVVGALGAGGGGVVFEARDPTLGRRVAIKLLHAERGDADGAARLVREAQALARLSNPNVVTIYEAGTDGDQVFLAMEKVTGSDARAWRAAGDRSFAAICDVYRQAAVGLSAAHQAGLVHRDVKPDNILVGDDGRVRITDFGLVAAAGQPGRGAPAALDDQAVSDDAATAPGPTPPRAAGGDPLAAPLTRTGTLLGTPPYMAPEAHLRGASDAASDQWSLCVAWWEALTGARPFVGRTYRDLVAAITAGTISRGREAIPPALAAVLERGLAIDPADRWPSVAALIAAIDRALADGRERVAVAPPAVTRARPARRWPWLMAGLAAAAAAAVAVAAWSSRAASPLGLVSVGRVAAAPAPSPPTPRRLTTPGGCPYMPAFADAATVVFDDGRGDLWTVPSAGGVPRRLTDAPGDQWRAGRGRADGEVIFVGPGGPTALDVASGRTTPLDVDAFAVAAADAAIFYGRTDVADIWRRAAGEDARVVALPDGLWQYALSASGDGRRLAITTHAQRSTVTVCVVEVAAPARPLACLERDDVIMGRAALTHDGATLYYQTRGGIRRRRLADGADQLWLPGAYAYGGIEVARDGRTLVYADTHPGEHVVAPIDAPDQAVLREAGSWADVAADGRWVHVRWNPDGSHQLVEHAPDGTRRVLVTGLGPLQHPLYDPSGRTVVFEVSGAEGGIWTVDVRAYPPQRLTLRDGDSNPVWTRDGKVAFTRWDELKRPNLMLADPADGSLADAARGVAHPQPRLSISTVPTTGELLLTGTDGSELFAWDPVTRRERRIPLGGMAPNAVASPDGRRLAILTGAGVSEVPFPAGTRTRPVPRWSPAPCAAPERPTWDAQGRLYVAYRPWVGDVYAVAIDD